MTPLVVVALVGLAAQGEDSGSSSSSSSSSPAPSVVPCATFRRAVFGNEDVADAGVAGGDQTVDELRVAAIASLRGEPKADKWALRTLAARDWAVARATVLGVHLDLDADVDVVQRATLQAFSTKAELHAWMKARGLPVRDRDGTTIVDAVGYGPECLVVEVLQYENPPQVARTFEELARAAKLNGVRVEQPADGVDPGCNVLKKRPARVSLDRPVDKVVTLTARKGKSESKAPMVFVNCLGDGFSLDVRVGVALINDLLRAQQRRERLFVVDEDSEHGTVYLLPGDALEAARERGLL